MVFWLSLCFHVRTVNHLLPILLVEDSDDDVLLTLRAFARCGLANPIIVVRDGLEALDWLFQEGAYASGRPPRQPALILLDLKLPKIDGLGVLRAMRADPRTQTIPVVMLTSSAEQRDLMESYRLGCNSYVQKPVDFAEFVVAARTLGFYWLLLNRRPDGSSV